MCEYVYVFYCTHDSGCELSICVENERWETDDINGGIKGGKKT